MGGPRGSYYGVPRQICLNFDVNLGGPLGSPQPICDGTAEQSLSAFFDGSPGLAMGLLGSPNGYWLLAPFLMGSPGLPSTGYWLLAMGLLGSPNGFWNWLLELTSGTGS